MKCQGLTMKDVVVILKKKMGDKSLRDFAEEIGLHYSQLSDVLNGHRELRNNKVLAHLGLKHEEHYRRI